MKNISILGSTGSIGTQVLEVIRNIRQYEVVCITANSNVKLLEAQIREFKPKIAVMYDEKSALQLRKRVKDTDTKIYSGQFGMMKAVSEKNLDLVVVCTVGMTALLPTLQAIKNRINIAIATKEILVSAGTIIMSMAKEYNINIIPIDSEHSAIMQCMDKNNKAGINKIILTASGGPFRGRNKEQLKEVTIAEALKHPTWNMGKKNTIDSATLMNKALEIIETSVLFDVTSDKIDVLIHPQSIVHSMVEYIDGSVIAQMSNPDMKIPIQYALSFPERKFGMVQSLDFKGLNLTFEKPNNKVFRAVDLGMWALDAGGSMTTVLNSANESAVNLFLNGAISFLDITALVEQTMKQHTVINNPSIKEILLADIWAKEYINSLVKDAYEQYSNVESLDYDLNNQGDWLM